MTAASSPAGAHVAELTASEQAIARSVLFASLFDYPLTLGQVRRTLVESEQTATEVLNAWGASARLPQVIAYEHGFFFPAGRSDLIDERRRREARSRAFLRRHDLLLRLICAMPYVELVALSGSIAHMNLDGGGDLDLFIVTRGRRVWSVTVAAIVLARTLGRRKTLCANFVVADSALTIDASQQDLFTASQIVHLKPLIGEATYLRFLDANPFVQSFFPNACRPEPATVLIHQGVWLQTVKRVLESTLAWPSAVAEAVCRWAYRAYLLRRSGSWQSPDQVRLDDDRLKLHTQSHRQRVLRQFDQKKGEAGI